MKRGINRGVDDTAWGWIYHSLMQARSVVPLRAVDAVLAVSITVAACVAGYQYRPEGWAPFDGTAYALTCLVVLPLAVRRDAPLTVLSISCGAYAVYLALGHQPSLNWWGPALALVSVATRWAPRVAYAACAPVFAVLLQSGVSGRLPVGVALLQAGLIPLIALAVGRTQQVLARRNVELRLLSAQLAFEQEERARRAVVDERIRIARELHDVVAHHMSVVSVQAGLAGYVFSSDAVTARSALGAVADASREALEELRRMLGVLRVDVDGGGPPDAPALHPLPGLARIGELVDRLAVADVTVEIRTEGETRPLAPGLNLCAYRVVQEALTNVVKHAAPARVEVNVTYLPEQLRITVRDDGGKDFGSSRGSSKSANALPVSGYGLIGMRERANLCGGSLSAGARSEGGFEVLLTLPTSAAPQVPKAP